MPKKDLIVEFLNKNKLSNQILTGLEAYVNLLLKWNKKINLIGKSTEDDIWERHILDSLQLLKYIENKNLLFADFGSGAGLPGIVLSIAGIKNISLIEKSYRKCEFLEEAKKISKNKITIINKNINEITNLKFDIITSRALASLNNLLTMVNPFLKNNSKSIFLKGKKLKEELTEAEKNFNIDYTIAKSITSDEGNIIIINSIKPIL